jgi:hypothetical protein
MAAMRTSDVAAAQVSLNLGSQNLCFVPKRQEAAGVWITLHNEEHNNLYTSPNIRVKLTEHVERMGQMRYASEILVEEPERKRPLRRPRCTREDNIKMDLRE